METVAVAAVTKSLPNTLDRVAMDTKVNSGGLDGTMLQAAICAAAKQELYDSDAGVIVDILGLGVEGILSECGEWKGTWCRCCKCGNGLKFVCGAFFRAEYFEFSLDIAAKATFAKPTARAFRSANQTLSSGSWLKMLPGMRNHSATAANSCHSNFAGCCPIETLGRQEKRKL